MTSTTTGNIVSTDIDTPVGPLRVAAVGESVVACCFTDHWDRTVGKVERRFPGAEWRMGESGPASAVQAYIDGDLTACDHLDVDTGGTEFQRRVWTALRDIPVGTTWSYSDLAAAAGSGGATRAVGSANGANPVWLVVPCHRVIRSDGALGGYGGGLDRKSWLLSHEGVAVAG